MSIAVNSFLTLALSENRAVAAGDVVSPEDMDLALLMLNEYLDFLNVNKRALYDTKFRTFTLTPNLQPHTIGLAANAPTFSVPVGRPTEIITANIILNNNIRSPLRILKSAEWNSILAGAAAGQAVTVTSSVPSYLYYSTEWTNGEIFLYAVPNTAYGLEIQTRTLLAAMALADTFDLPMGYQRAVRLSVAEICAPHLGLPLSQDTKTAAREARIAVWGNNDVIPNLNTRDAGMPGTGGGWFNYRTGFMDTPGGPS